MLVAREQVVKTSRWPAAPSPPPATGALGDRWSGRVPRDRTTGGYSSVQRDVHDLVIAVVGCAVLVAAAAGQPQSTVGARFHRPQPAELSLEDRLRGAGTSALDLHDPQPLAAQRRH